VVVALTLLGLQACAPEGSPGGFDITTGTEAGLPAPGRGGLPVGVTLTAALSGTGYALPGGSHVYAARVGGQGRILEEYEAGLGARTNDFWPASSIKLMAAVGALDFLASLGFTGAATVTVADDWSATVRSLADDAIRTSDNWSYDRLLEVAGVERLNTVFLPAQGYRATRIQRSYGDWNVRDSPAMTISEGGREVEVPFRPGQGDYGCDESNCSSLRELTDSVRRVVLHDDLPDRERFRLDRADARALSSALLGAEGFLEPGVADALGRGVLVYKKPGWVEGLDCVDVALVDDRRHGRRYLLGLAAPDVAGLECAMLPDMAEHVLEVLSRG
jgi:hypothetical protein